MAHKRFELSFAKSQFKFKRKMNYSTAHKTSPHLECYPKAGRDLFYDESIDSSSNSIDELFYRGARQKCITHDHNSKISLYSYSTINNNNNHNRYSRSSNSV